MIPDEKAEAVVEELLHTPEGRRDPYPRYHRLRAIAPVHRRPNGMWFLTRHVDCAAALRDPRLGKDYEQQSELRFGPEWRRHPAVETGRYSMLNLDGPAHMRLRRLVVKAFTPQTVLGLRPKIEEMVDGLLAPFEERGGGEILESLAFPLPVNVIGELVGVPESDRAQFRTLVRDFLGILEPQPTLDQIEAANHAHLAIRSYFIGLITEKRRRPGEDLLSRLVLAEHGQDRLSDEELTTMASLLFSAGFETTTHLIGNGLLGLLRQPNELERLRRDPSVAANLPEELLRYDGTAQLVSRFTKSDVEIGGVAVPRGETVMAILGAANHDPARYADPDRIDVGRRDIQPLSFGGGVPYCLGAALATAEIDIVFRKLLERFETIELDGEPPRHRDRLTLRGLESLPIKCRPATTGKHAWAMKGTSLGLRPAPGAAPTDAEWRNAFRAGVESEAIAREMRSERPLDTIVLLARAPLFRACTADELGDLALTAYPMSFEPGEQLCLEGGESLECYVIAEGEATVSIGGQVVAKVGEDDVVGERGPLEGRARTATVTAETHMMTWAISRERLLALVEKSSAAKQGMFDYIKRRYGKSASSSGVQVP